MSKIISTKQAKRADTNLADIEIANMVDRMPPSNIINDTPSSEYLGQLNELISSCYEIAAQPNIMEKTKANIFYDRMNAIQTYYLQNIVNNVEIVDEGSQNITSFVDALMNLPDHMLFSRIIRTHFVNITSLIQNKVSKYRPPNEAQRQFETQNNNHRQLINTLGNMNSGPSVYNNTVITYNNDTPEQITQLVNEKNKEIEDINRERVDQGEAPIPPAVVKNVDELRPTGFNGKYTQADIYKVISENGPYKDLTRNDQRLKASEIKLYMNKLKKKGETEQDIINSVREEFNINVAPPKEEIKKETKVKTEGDDVNEYYGPTQSTPPARKTEVIPPEQAAKTETETLNRILPKTNQRILNNVFKMLEGVEKKNYTNKQDLTNDIKSLEDSLINILSPIKNPEQNTEIMKDGQEIEQRIEELLKKPIQDNSPGSNKSSLLNPVFRMLERAEKKKYKSKGDFDNDINEIEKSITNILSSMKTPDKNPKIMKDGQEIERRLDNLLDKMNQLSNTNEKEYLPETREPSMEQGFITPTRSERSAQSAQFGTPQSPPESPEPKDNTLMAIPSFFFKHKDAPDVKYTNSTKQYSELAVEHYLNTKPYYKDADGKQQEKILRNTIAYLRNNNETELNKLGFTSKGHRMNKAEFLEHRKNKKEGSGIGDLFRRAVGIKKGKTPIEARREMYATRKKYVDIAREGTALEQAQYEDMVRDLDKIIAVNNEAFSKMTPQQQNQPVTESLFDTVVRAGTNTFARVVGNGAFRDLLAVFYLPFGGLAVAAIHVGGEASSIALKFAEVYRKLYPVEVDLQRDRHAHELNILDRTQRHELQMRRRPRYEDQDYYQDDDDQPPQPPRAPRAHPQAAYSSSSITQPPINTTTARRTPRTTRPRDDDVPARDILSGNEDDDPTQRGRKTTAHRVEKDGSGSRIAKTIKIKGSTQPHILISMPESEYKRISKFPAENRHKLSHKIQEIIRSAHESIKWTNKDKNLLNKTLRQYKIKINNGKALKTHTQLPVPVGGGFMKDFFQTATNKIMGGDFMSGIVPIWAKK